MFIYYFLFLLALLLCLWVFYFLNKNKNNVYTQIKKDKTEKKKKDDDYGYEDMKNYKMEKISDEDENIENIEKQKEIINEEIEIQKNEKQIENIKEEIEIQNKIENKDVEEVTTYQQEKADEININKETLINDTEEHNSFEIVEEEEVDLNIDDLISEFLDYIHNKKVIHLSDLSNDMNTSKNDMINKLRDVESDNQFGFVDKSGRYINLNEQELALFEKLLLSNKKKIKKSQLIKEFAMITGVKK
jgi:hypothetical protein